MIEDSAELQRLIAAAREESRVAHAYILICLDAGLRSGEALALQWGKIAWGEDENDRSRSLRIDANLPEGGSGDYEPPKSGRSRQVELSRKLRRALGELFEARFGDAPSSYDPTGRILVGIDRANFRGRTWPRILRRAGLGRWRLKDLRSTFASQLLTAASSSVASNVSWGTPRP